MGGMHLRITTVRRPGKEYRYVQLVESYRRKDGMPTKRVIGNLGDLPRQTEKNLRIALEASREGKAVLVAPNSPGLTDSHKVKANLRYLDIAVMLEMWRSSGLGELLDQLLPEAESAMRGSDVVTTLSIQRCVAPGSKLQAQRYRYTAELLTPGAGPCPLARHRPPQTPQQDTDRCLISLGMSGKGGQSVSAPDMGGRAGKPEEFQGEEGAMSGVLHCADAIGGSLHVAHVALRTWTGLRHCATLIRAIIQETDGRGKTCAGLDLAFVLRCAELRSFCAEWIA